MLRSRDRMIFSLDTITVTHYLNRFRYRNPILQIVVNNAPDLRVRGERERVMRLAYDMATTSHSAGADSLQFWLLEMSK